MRKDEIEPTVTLIVPAHDEEDVIGARVENLLELDYPADKLEVVVASDGSTDRTRRDRARLRPACAAARVRARREAADA